MSESVGGVSRSGRVRKKSAKLMEMEDFDTPDLESELDGRGRKKHHSSKHGDISLNPVALQGIPASGYISDHPGLSAKLKEIKHPKKSKSKLDSPLKALSPLKINVGDLPRLRASEEEGSDSSLRLKLILSPKEKGSPCETEYSSSELSPIKKEEKKKKKKVTKAHHESGMNTLALLAAGGLLSSSINPSKPKSKSKKKSSSKDHIKHLSFSSCCDVDSPDVDIGLDELGHSSELVIAEPKPPKKKKSSSKKSSGEPKVKVKLEPPEQIPEFSVQLCEDDDEMGSIALPGTLVPHSRSVYLLEKKKGKKKKSGAIVQNKKDKKKGRPMTAYMLWCREHRQRIVAENPDMDFATISRRLGEAWQSLTDKQKLNWRRKAKRLAAKTAHLINTGKKEHTGSKLLHKQHKHQATDSDSSPNPRDMFKVVGTSPIDVAAHLKLLGESLSIIGQRLTEHEGQIAVSGSLSVLLDSTLCALGPLLCLTAEIPEVNGCRPEVLGGILDNIAYIMPGL